MYLSDISIQEYLHNGLIEVTPKLKKKDIRPAGIRIHLSNKILIPHPGYLDLSKPGKLEYSTVDLTKDEFILKPNDFILASSVEKIKVAKNIITFLDGRSTIARLGITIHITAGVVDGNHSEARAITLEIKNLGVHSIRLRENDPVGLVMFALLTSDINQPSQSQYAGQEGVLPPNLMFRPGIDK